MNISLLTLSISLFSELAILAISLSIILGWGLIASSALGLKQNIIFYSSNLWRGLFLILLFLEFTQIIFPNNYLLFLISLAIGAIGIFLNRQMLSDFSIKFFSSTAKKYFLPLFLLIIIIWCLKSMAYPEHPDAGLYHFQSIRWLNESPIQLGIANLHSRLAYNQSYFQILAWLNIFPLWNKGYALGGVLLSFMVSLTIIESYIYKRRGGFWITFFLFFAIANSSKYFSSPSPDVAISLIQIAIFVYALLLLDQNSDYIGQLHEEKILNQLCDFFLLCIMAFAFKLSALIFSMCMYLTIAVACRKIIYKNRKYLLKITYLCMPFLFVHFLRGYLQSGYPIYPSIIGGAPFLEWSVLRADAINEVRWIYSWGRTPGLDPVQVLGKWDWLSGWIARLDKNQLRWIFTAGGLTFLSLLMILIKPYKTCVHLLWLYPALVFATAFWFFTAPDWRFLGSLPELWITIAGTICINKATQLEFFRAPKAFKKVIAPAGFALILILILRVSDLKSIPLSGWSKLPEATLLSNKTETGLIIYTPQKEGLCWDAKLPCTPIFNSEVSSYKIEFFNGYIKKFNNLQECAQLRSC